MNKAWMAALLLCLQGCVAWADFGEFEFDEEPAEEADAGAESDAGAKGGEMNWRMPMWRQMAETAAREGRRRRVLQERAEKEKADVSNRHPVHDWITTGEWVE